MAECTTLYWGVIEDYYGNDWYDLCCYTQPTQTYDDFITGISTTYNNYCLKDRVFADYVTKLYNNCLSGVSSGMSGVYVTGGTANGTEDTLIFTNSSGGTFTVANSALLFNDAFVSGGTLDSATGCVTFVNTSGGTFQVCGFDGFTSYWSANTDGSISTSGVTDVRISGDTFNKGNLGVSGRTFLGTVDTATATAADKILVVQATGEIESITTASLTAFTSDYWVGNGSGTGIKPSGTTTNVDVTGFLGVSGNTFVKGNSFFDGLMSGSGSVIAQSLSTLGGIVTGFDGNSTQWNSAYNNQVTAFTDAGTSTVTLTLTQLDGGALTTSFANPQGTMSSWEARSDSGAGAAVDVTNDDTVLFTSGNNTLNVTNSGLNISLNLADTAVTPGTYTNSTLTVDQQGRLTSAASGSDADYWSANTDGSISTSGVTDLKISGNTFNKGNLGVTGRTFLGTIDAAGGSYSNDKILVAQSNGEVEYLTTAQLKADIADADYWTANTDGSISNSGLTGHVGVGTDTPNKPLTVVGDISGTTAIYLGNHTNFISGETSTSGDLSIHSGDDIEMYAGDDIVLNTNCRIKFTYLTGTTAPHSTPGIEFSLDDSPGNCLIQNGQENTVIAVTSADTRLYFNDIGGEYIVGDGTDLTIASGTDIILNPTAHAGIGISAPTTKLHIVDTGEGEDPLRVQTVQTGNGYMLLIQEDGVVKQSKKVTVTSTGDVGISGDTNINGELSAHTNVHVSGEVGISGNTNVHGVLSAATNVHVKGVVGISGATNIGGTLKIPTPFTLGDVSVLPTGVELNYVNGVTSDIQTQFGGKQATITANSIAWDKMVNLTGGRAVYTNDSGDITVSDVTSTELGYLDGVSSAIQTQITARLQLVGGTMSGPIAMGANKITGVTDPTAAQDAATKAYVDSKDHAANTLQEVTTAGASTNLSISTAGLVSSGIVDITNETDATDETGDTGALRTEGGASIAKRLYVGGGVVGNLTGEVTGNASTATKIASITNTNIVQLISAQTLTNKTLTTPVITSISNSGTVTIPTGTDTLVARTSTDTLTNKTLTAPVIAMGTNKITGLGNPTEAQDAVTKAYVDALDHVDYWSANTDGSISTSGVTNVKISGNTQIAGVLNVTGDGNFANLQVPATGKLRFDDVTGSDDQYITGNENNITIDGDQKVKLIANDTIEIGVATNNASIIIDTSEGHITTSGLTVMGNTNISGTTSYIGAVSGTGSVTAIGGFVGEVTGNASTATKIASIDNNNIALLNGTQTFTGTNTLNSFKGTGSITVTDIKNTNNFSDASTTSLATSASIKAYVDSKDHAANTLQEVTDAGNTTTTAVGIQGTLTLGASAGSGLITTNNNQSLFVKPTGSGNLYFGNAGEGFNIYHYNSGADGTYAIYDFNNGYYRLKTTQTAGIHIDDTLKVTGMVTGNLTGEVTGNAATATKIASITNTNIVQLTGAQTLVSKTLTAPTFTDAVLGQPDSGDLTNCTGYPAGQLPTSIPATKIADGSVTNAEFQYINTLSSNAQTQFAGKVGTTGNETIAGLKTFSNNVTMANTADLKFVDQAGSYPTSGKGFDWTLNNDGARIYAVQPSSDSIDLTFELRDNATTNDRFVFHVNDYRGAGEDKYPLIIRGGTQFDLVDSALYTDGTIRLSNAGALTNVTNTNWDAAYNDKITGFTDSGTDTIALTLTQQDGGTLTTSFANPQGTMSSFNVREDNTGTPGSSTNVTNGETLTFGGGIGIKFSVPNENITADIDLNELATSTTNTDGDFFVVVDSADGSQHKLTKGNINNSGFNNDANYTTNTGTVTSVSGGTGVSISSSASVTPIVNIDTVGADNAILTNTAATPVGTDTMWFSDADDSTIKKATISSFPGFGKDGTVTSVGAITLGTSGNDLSSTVANGTTSAVITLNVPTASASNRGALSSTDWTTFNNKTTNLGTVTSVASTTAGDALDVAVSNSTTAPAIALTWAGDDTEYIDGEGNLTTFPSIPQGDITSVTGGVGITVSNETGPSPSVAVDGTVIRTTGNQTIGGTKTFSSTIAGSINGIAAVATTVRVTDNTGSVALPVVFNNEESAGILHDDTGTFTYTPSSGTLIVPKVTASGGFDGNLDGNATTATKIASITNTNIVQLISAQTLTNKTLTSPTLTTPVLGTPSSGNLSNCTGYPAGQLPTGIPATSIADGSVTNAEFQYINTLSSNAQTQISSKQPTITTNSIAWDKMVNLTAGRAVYTNDSGDVTVSDVTSTELGYLDGVSSAIQTQITARLQLVGGTMSGPIAMGANKITGVTDPTAAQDAATKAYVDSKDHAANTLQEVTTAGATSNVAITLSNKLTVSGEILDVTGEDPRVRLYADAGDHPGFELYDGTTRKWILYNDPNDSHNLNIKAQDANTDRVSITQTGKVGIGTTDPQKMLDIAGGDIRLDNSKGIYFATTDANISRVSIIGDEGSDFIRMKVDNSNSHVLQLNTTGVGIGTISPRAKLAVSNDGGHTTGTVGIANSSLDLYNPLEANTDEKGSILTFSDNYFGGGSYNPTTRAGIKGGTDSVSNTADGFLAFYTDSSGADTMPERMRIDHDGNVGIGTTSPATTLDVVGDIKASTIVNASSDTDKFLVSDSGVFKYRTGAQVRSDIGAGTGNGTVTSVAAITLGTSGTDLSSTVANGTTSAAITLNVPTASASNRGALSSTDWSTFNNKTSNTGTVTATNGSDNEIAVFSSGTNIDGDNQLTWNGSTFTMGGANNQITQLNIIGSDDDGAPAFAAAINFTGYETRGQGIFHRDTSASGEEWFSGINYGASFNRWSVGYDLTGGQAEYVANAKLSVYDTGQIQFVGYGQSTFAGTVATFPAFAGDGLIVDRTPAQVRGDIGAQATITTNSIAWDKMVNLTASRAVYTNSDGDITVSDVTSTELGYLDGVSSAIQTQFDGKQPTITTNSIAWDKMVNLTAGRAVYTNSSGDIEVSNVTSTELGYLDGVSSVIQTQLNAKLPKVGGTMSGPIAMGANKITGVTDPTAAQDAATKAYVDSKDHAANTLQEVTTAGASTNLSISTAGLTSSGNITIQASSPVLKIDAPDSGYPEIYFTRLTGDDQNARIKLYANQLRFENAGDPDSTYLFQGRAAGAGGLSDFLKIEDTGITTAGAILSGIVDITNTTDSSDATGDTGALRTEGGVSIAKKLYVGSTITGNLTGEVTGNASTATKIASITNTNIVQLISAQTLTNKTLTAPTFTDPVLGTPSSGNLSNCTGYPAGQLPTGIPATSIADGTVTNAEFQYINTLSSNAQTQFDGKQPTITTNSIAWDKMVNLTAGRAVYTNSNGDITVSDVTSTELGYLDGVSSAIQTQITARLQLVGGTMSGPIAMGANKITGVGDPTAAQDAATKVYVDTKSGGGIATNTTVRSAQYTSLPSGSSTNAWHTLFTITDTMGPVLCKVYTYAHDAIEFSVAEGYGPSNAGSITLINSVNTANGGFATVQAVRIKQDGVVEIQLQYTSGPTVNIGVNISGYNVPTLATTLAIATSSAAVVDGVTVNQTGIIRSKNVLQVGGSSTSTSTSAVRFTNTGNSFINGNSSDKFGIGTASPTEKLHVVGNILTSGNIIIPDGGNIGSVSDADAIAIASDGVVTLSQKAVIDGGIDVDNFNIDGTTIALSSGNMTISSAGIIKLDSENDIVLDANGADILFKDDNIEIGRFKNISSDFVMRSVVSNRDLIFQGSNGGTNTTALTLDMSEAGKAIFNAGATFAGEVAMGSNKITGVTDPTSNQDAATKAYVDSKDHAANTLQEVTTAGATSNVAITLSNTFTVGVNDTGHDVKLFGATSERYMLWDQANDRLKLVDNVKAIFGTGNDLQIYHDTNNSYISNEGTGDLYVRNQTDDLFLQASDDVFIKPQGGENGIDVVGNAGVTLYYDNSSKLATVTGGVTITGELEADSLDIDGNSQLDGTLTVGTNGVGYDVKFFGDTEGQYMLWDQANDKLIVTGEIEATKFDGALEGNADTATKIADITNTNIVQLASTQTLTNKTLTAPTFTDAVLGQPDSGDLTNCTGYPAGQLPTSISATKIADGTVTNAEFQYINTLSSNAQTQISSKQATITTNSIAWDKMVNLTASRAVYTNSSGDITVSDVTYTELEYLKNVSSNIQNQINAKQPTITTNSIAWDKMANLTASRAVYTNSNGDVTVSDVTSTELGYLDGVSSAIQTQLNTKAGLTSPRFVTPAIMPGGEGSESFVTITANSEQSTANLTLTMPVLTENDTFAVVGRAETLENKTLTTPIIAQVKPNSSTTLTMPAATDTLVGKATTDTLTNKTLTTPVITSISNSGTVNIPSGADTLVARTSTDTLTNKTLTAPTIRNASIAMGTNKITGVGNPTDAQDAATKAYIDAREDVYMFSNRGQGQTDATHWYGPNFQGIYNYSWSKDYGTDSQVLTLEEDYINTGLLVPYDCILTGFFTIGHTNTGTAGYSCGLWYITQGNLASSLNVTSGQAGNATLTLAGSIGTTANPGSSKNPLTLDKRSSMSITLAAGSMIYPRVGDSAVVTDTTWNVYLKRT